MLGTMTEPPTERADAARNRRKILDAAARLVAAEGAAGLSLDLVAKAADVGVGTVYRRFGDRAGLVFALLEDRERRFREKLDGPPPLGPGAPPGLRVRAFLHALVDLVEEQRELLLLAEASSPAPVTAARPTPPSTPTWPRCSKRRLPVWTPPTSPTRCSRRSPRA